MARLELYTPRTRLDAHGLRGVMVEHEHALCIAGTRSPTRRETANSTGLCLDERRRRGGPGARVRRRRLRVPPPEVRKAGLYLDAALLPPGCGGRRFAPGRHDWPLQGHPGLQPGGLLL